ncbi:hypothetical protein M3G91_24995 [Micromonospora chalcea]|uniref:hypothetical protein n=1 Tax=Micromonospora chalcea TaxID=1874 RepID=UPI0021A79A86|nr:hypothetical protein [Micromonospora chalcea]MCT2280877.1 hypothetical protein [Micromonospora chalcea]
MVERNVNPPSISFRHSGGRIPDGHIVPHPPRHLPPAEQPPPATFAERWWAALFIAITLAAMAIGALR